MTSEEKVKRVYPDADISSAFAKQQDGSKKWMYCVMSHFKFITSRGQKNRVQNVGPWRFSATKAWDDAWRNIQEQQSAGGNRISVKEIAAAHGFKPLTKQQEDDNFDRATKF